MNMISLAANVSRRSFESSTGKVSSTLGRISSGQAIQKASDGISNLSIGSKFQSQVTSLKAAMTNASQASSLLGVADGSVKTVIDMLQRQKSLILQASSPAVDDNLRLSLNMEFQGYAAEIDRVASTTEFNGIKLLDGNLNVAPSKPVESDLVLNTTSGSTELKFQTQTQRNFTLAGSTAPISWVDSQAAGNLDVTIDLGTDHGFKVGDKMVFAKVGAAFAAEPLKLLTSAANTTTNTISNVVGSKITFSVTTTGAVAAPSTTTSSNDLGANTITFMPENFDVAPAAGKTHTFIPGDVVEVNGVKLVARAVPTLPNEFKVTSDQTPQALAESIKETIRMIVNDRKTGFASLEAVHVDLNKTKDGLVFTNKAKGAVGDCIDVRVRSSNLSPTRFLDSDNNVIVSTGSDSNSSTRLSLTGGTKTGLGFGNVESHAQNSNDSLVVSSRTGDHGFFKLKMNRQPVAAGAPNAEVTALKGTVTTVGDDKTLMVTFTGHGLKSGDFITNSKTFTFAQAHLGTGADINVQSDSSFKVSKVLNANTFLIQKPDGGDINPGLDAGGRVASTDIEFRHKASDGGQNSGDQININGSVFRYVSTLTGANDEILIGATEKETITNTVRALNSSEDPRVMMATYSYETTTVNDTPVYSLIGTSKLAGNDMPIGFDGNSRVSGGSRLFGDGTPLQANGSYDIRGMDARFVTNNPEFIGNLSGMKASYNSQNNVSCEIKVGNYVYRSENISSSYLEDTWVTFDSVEDGGGFFKMQFKGGEGMLVRSQVDADKFAERLDVVLNGISFTQTRDVKSFGAYGDIVSDGSFVGSLNDASVRMCLSDFNSSGIQDVQFTYSNNVNGYPAVTPMITMIVDNQVFRYTLPTGEKTISAGSTVRLKNQSNPNEYIDLKVGKRDLSLASSTSAEAIEKAYKKALGVGEQSIDAGLKVQVGQNPQDIINLSLRGVKTSDLYKNDKDAFVFLDISNLDGVKLAMSVIDNALERAMNSRSDVGVMMKRFEYASDTILTSMSGQEEARAVLLDSDVAEDSTELARHNAQITAAINALSQANQMYSKLEQLLR